MNQDLTDAQKKKSKNEQEFSLTQRYTHSLIRNRFTHDKVAKLVCGRGNLRLLDGVDMGEDDQD